MRINYFYNKQPISRQNFIDMVPENWMDQIDETGYYSYGYYHCQVIND